MRLSSILVWVRALTVPVMPGYSTDMNRTGQGNDLASIVGANIRLARGKRTQRELAADLGVSAQQVSDWERGDYRPNDGNLIRIGETLDREFAWFFTEHEPVKDAA